jgi:hypothetical protein
MNKQILHKGICFLMFRAVCCSSCNIPTNRFESLIGAISGSTSWYVQELIVVVKANDVAMRSCR